jgi:GT2 family glycosyltransferase
MSVPSPLAVSIVITNWNTRLLLDALLSSIETTTSPDMVETIVVDNGSVDGSPAMIEEKYPWVQVVKNAMNRGYAGANNQGIGLARGRFVLLLGSDTVVHPGTVATLVTYLDTHPDVGAAGCRLLNPDLTPQASCKRFPTLRDGIVTYLSLHGLAQAYNMHDFDFYKTQFVDQPAGTCLLLRRPMLVELHGFDERYGLLYNDVDLCQRIKALGWNIAFVADTELKHHGSMSTRSAPAGVRLKMYQDILRYYRAHFGWPAYAALAPILSVRLLLAVVNKLSRRGVMRGNLSTKVSL